MQYKLSNFLERNTDVPEVKSDLNTIKSQMDTIRNHTCSLPFESEPSEFLILLSTWHSKKEKSEDDYGR